MSEEKKEKSLPKKRPTPLKRDIQNEKKRAKNRAFKARVRTAINAFEKAAATGDATKELSAVYSMMDKGVKRGLYKLNRASRTKARLSTQAAKSA